ncbi:hypothetical protein SDJN03_09868, partial [Cucurbita argyrosperma subsp. sororia]
MVFIPESLKTSQESLKLRSPEAVVVKPPDDDSNYRSITFYHDKIFSRIQLLPEFLKAQRTAASDMRRNCSVALGNVNISKNRYTDVLTL